jgi:hypothetical protein
MGLCQMDDRDTSYFRRRLEEERSAAEQSSDPVVQIVHLRLADRYETMLGEAEKNDAVAVPHLVPMPPPQTF